MYESAPANFDGAFDALKRMNVSEFTSSGLAALRDTINVLREQHTYLDMLVGPTQAKYFVPLEEAHKKGLEVVQFLVTSVFSFMFSGPTSTKPLVGGRGGGPGTLASVARIHARVARLKRVAERCDELRGGGRIGQAWTWIKKTALGTLATKIASAIVAAGSKIAGWLAARPLAAIAGVLFAVGAYAMRTAMEEDEEEGFCKQFAGDLMAAAGLGGGEDSKQEALDKWKKSGMGLVYTKLAPIWTCTLDNIILAPITALRTTLQSVLGWVAGPFMTLVSAGVQKLGDLLYRQGYKVAGMVLGLLCDLRNGHQHILQVAPIVCLQPFLRFAQVYDLIMAGIDTTTLEAKTTITVRVPNTLVSAGVKTTLDNLQKLLNQEFEALKFVFSSQMQKTTKGVEVHLPFSGTDDVYAQPLSACNLKIEYNGLDSTIQMSESGVPGFSTMDTLQELLVYLTSANLNADNKKYLVGRTAWPIGGKTEIQTTGQALYNFRYNMETRSRASLVKAEAEAVLKKKTTTTKS